MSKRDNLKWSFIRAISQIGEGRYKIQYPKKNSLKKGISNVWKLSQWREERKIQKGICRKWANPWRGRLLRCSTAKLFLNSSSSSHQEIGAHPPWQVGDDYFLLSWPINRALSSSPYSVLFDRIQVGRRWDVWDQQHVGSCSENNTRRYEEKCQEIFSATSNKNNTRRCEEKCQEIICENFHNMTIAIVAVDFVLLYCAKRLS